MHRPVKSALPAPCAIPALLGRVARLRSRELFTLAVLALALGIAVGAAALFDVSFALGAFFAGVIVSESDFSHEAATNALGAELDAAAPESVALWIALTVWRATETGPNPASAPMKCLRCMTRELPGSAPRLRAD